LTDPQPLHRDPTVEAAMIHDVKVDDAGQGIEQRASGAEEDRVSGEQYVVEQAVL
jgi:hypothetical protein